MSWVNGRQMASASDGTNTYSYIYDAAGSRIMKNVGTVNHLYFYVNGMLLMEYRYNAMGDTTDVLQYFYDANGKPHAMAYNGTVYLYVTNLQGDIVALLGLDGTVSGYEYDPYGNVIASYGDIAAINPLRYRGYYYDNETGLYYLQSRYYDPVVGRFINADSYASTGQGILGNNMFAYCNNNPSLYTDSVGSRPVVYTINGEEPEDAREWSYAYMRGETRSVYSSNSNGGTLSLGLSGSIGIGPWAIGGQACITFDTDGYVAIQYGVPGGISADAAPLGFSLSAMPYLTVTNSPSYRGLEGPGIQVGMSTPMVTIDYNAMLDANREDILYHGFTIATGISTPNFHVTWGDTFTFAAVKFDFFEYMETVQYYSTLR